MNPRHQIFFFILISLAAHLLLFYFMLPLWEKFGLPDARPDKTSDVIQVTLLPKDVRLADIPKPEREETPEDAKFAALYNQKVKHEQVAKPRPPVKADGPSQTAERAAANTPRKPASQEPSLSKNQETHAKASKPANASDSRFGASTYPEDFFPDYTYGNHTYVNALRYPNIQYFVELKRRFTTAFNPIPTLRENRGALPPSKIEVVLGVTVDGTGNLSELIVIKGSGLAPYDDNARKTVKTSAPFRSPPANLLDADKLLRMSWTFTVSFK